MVTGSKSGQILPKWWWTMTRQVRCMRDADEKFKVDNVLNVHYVYILCAHATLFNLTRDTANVFSVARQVDM